MPINKDWFSIENLIIKYKMLEWRDVKDDKSHQKLVWRNSDTHRTTQKFLPPNSHYNSCFKICFTAIILKTAWNLCKKWCLVAQCRDSRIQYILSDIFLKYAHIPTMAGFSGSGTGWDNRENENHDTESKI